MIDQIRAYWDARPCNLKHGTADVGTAEYFDQVRARKYFVEPHLPPFAAFAHWRGKHVLEVGSGLGTCAVDFARAGALVSAVELSPYSLFLTGRNAETAGVRDRMHLVESDAAELRASLWPHAYDLIWSWGVLHHTPDPAAVLRELCHYANARTELRLMLYHRLSTKTLGLLRYWQPGHTWDEAVARQSEAQAGCPITHTYTRAQARRLLEANGWQVQSIAIDHIFPYQVAAYREHRYVEAFPWSLIPAGLFRWLEKRLGWHLLITARRAP